MGIVYRIQSKEDRKRSAYRSHASFEKAMPAVERLLKAHISDDDHEHPTPKCDTGRNPKFNEHCGCDSAAKLLRWFRGFIPDLLREGYEIVALHNVIVTAVGEKQVLFKWND